MFWMMRKSKAREMQRISRPHTTAGGRNSCMVDVWTPSGISFVSGVRLKRHGIGVWESN